MSIKGLAGIAVSAGLLAALCGPALAQGSGSAAAGPEMPGAGAESEASELAAPPLSPAADLPVLFVASLEVLRTAAEPRIDIVRVTGWAASQGWSSPQLVPTYPGKPVDGILDLQFIATPPRLSQDAEGFAEIDAVLPVSEGRPFRGVRVRGSENVLVVKQIPGSSQAEIGVNDCSDCLGKKFVEAGNAQAGQPGTIRQEDFPRLLRVIRASDGIRGNDLNPNRLTLILDEDSTIVEAFWE